MRTPLETPPQFLAGFAPYFAAMQLAERPETLDPFAPSQLPAFECLKSLDDLDEEPDADEDDEDDDEEDDDDLDEDEDDDLDEDYEDEDEEEDEEEEDEDGGVKPLKMR